MHVARETPAVSCSGRMEISGRERGRFADVSRMSFPSNNFKLLYMADGGASDLKCWNVMAERT